MNESNEEMPPDPFGDAVPLTENVTDEVRERRRVMTNALIAFLGAVESCTEVDPHCVIHENHWGWVVPSRGLTYTVDLHDAPNRPRILVELPMDNIVAQRAAEQEKNTP